MDITFLGAVGAIGGNKFLLTDGVDKDSRILLDFGMMFGDPKSYAESGGAMGGSIGAFYDEFLQPRSNAGLRDLIRLGVLPEMEGLYRKDWLVTPEYRRALERHLGEVPFPDYWESDLESYQEHKKRTGRPYVEGILVTHAHADHFQHLAYVDPEIPVYCTAVTRSIVKTAADVGKTAETQEAFAAKEKGLQQNKAGTWVDFWKFAAASERPRKWCVITPYEWFQVGAFRVQALPIDHSVPGACFFLIKGKDGKRVLYTGDFRFHGVYQALSGEAKNRLAGKQPDALLCEGTRIDNERTVHETDVLAATKETMKETRGLVMAEWGWKDATRFLTMQQAAETSGRTLLVDPRVAYMLQDLSRVEPEFKPIEKYSNVRVYLRRKKSLLYSPQDYEKHELGYKTRWSSEDKLAVTSYLTSEDGIEAPPALVHYERGVRADQVRKSPEKYVVQSSFFQMSELFDLDPPQGSYYIKASCEPFNDEMKSDHKKHLNWLSSFNVGSNLVENEHGHHTSGHAGAAELAEFWGIVQPKILFPVHTLYPERYEEHWKGDVHPPKYKETFTI